MHSAEAREAFSRARSWLAASTIRCSAFPAYYGLWVGGYTRGEKIDHVLKLAEALLKEAESRPDTAEASIAHRITGVTCWVSVATLRSLATIYKKAVALYRPERDRELALVSAQDIGVSAMVYLVVARNGYSGNTNVRASL